MSEPIKAPFPWFGGKSRAAEIIWQRFGDVPNYVDPFAGSGTTCLAARDAGRRYVGIEINAEYVEIINRRLGVPNT